MELINSLSSTSPTVLSDIEYPFRSEFVLSDINAKTPLFPNAANLHRSIFSPSIGV